jgi:hypothetical protein
MLQSLGITKGAHSPALFALAPGGATDEATDGETDALVGAALDATALTEALAEGKGPWLLAALAEVTAALFCPVGTALCML